MEGHVEESKYDALSKISVFRGANYLILTCGAMKPLFIHRESIKLSNESLTGFNLSKFERFDVVGIFGILRINVNQICSEYLICIEESSCVASFDHKRVFRVNKFRCVKISKDIPGLLEEDKRAQEHPEDYLKFLQQFQFHFSTDYDFTHTMQRWAKVRGLDMDRRFYWNAFAASRFSDYGFTNWIVPVTDAFVEAVSEPLTKCQYVVISRRGKRRQGARYIVRGLDLLGNTANFVETEQIVCYDGKLASFVQIRGSIPLIWQQRGKDGEFNAKPQAKVSYSAMWQVAHDRHWSEIETVYGSKNLVALSLVNFHGHEGEVGRMYEFAGRSWNHRFPDKAYSFLWYDFHEICKGNRYDLLDPIIDNVFKRSVNSGFFLKHSDQSIESFQMGVTRTNCIDCLDRTNVMQSALAWKFLVVQLQSVGLDGETVFQSLSGDLKHVWANNADEMSKRYTGVGAMKSDFTRTGKRTGKGMLQDGLKSVQRIAQHVFRDSEKQILIEQLSGGMRAINRRVAVPIPGKLEVFFASKLPCHGVDATAWLQVVGPNLDVLEIYIEHGVIVKFSPAQQLEYSIPFAHIFKFGTIPEKIGGCRIWLYNNPDPVKLFFFSNILRERFLQILSPFVMSMQKQPKTYFLDLDIMLVNWTSPKLDFTEASPTTVAQETFGRLPRTAALVVLSLQDVQYSLPTDERIDSLGFPVDLHFVHLFLMYMGTDYQLVQCVQDTAGKTMMAICLKNEFLPYLENVQGCEVGVTAKDKVAKASKSLSSMVLDKLSGRSSAVSEIGCASFLTLHETPLCFINTGNVTRQAGDSDLYSLQFMGLDSEKFATFNVIYSARNTFWMGSFNPFEFDVSPWLSLASHKTHGNILAVSEEIKDLLSSDPGTASFKATDDNVSRPVACFFRLPFCIAGGMLAVLKLSLSNVHLTNTGNPAAQQVFFSSPRFFSSHHVPCNDLRATTVLQLLVPDPEYARHMYITINVLENSAIVGRSRLYLSAVVDGCAEPNNPRSQADVLRLGVWNQYSSLSGALNLRVKWSFRAPSKAELIDPCQFATMDL